MLNLLIAVGCAVASWAALVLPHLLRGGEAAVPATIVLVAAYLVLARRSFRALEAIFTEGAQALQRVPPLFDVAIATMQRAYRLGRFQFGIRSQVDTQIGVVYFLQKDFGRALPYLQRSLMFGHWLGGAMLAVVYYKKGNAAKMKQALDVVVRRAKKQGLAWSLYAYLLQQIGERDAAIAVLGRGARVAGADGRVKDGLLALQNGKKLKMRAYKDQWYQLHLERPPAEMAQAGFGGRMGRVARRGRW